MPNVTAGYGMLSDLTAFLRIFLYYNMLETLKLHQKLTNCVLRHERKLLQLVFLLNINTSKDR